MQTEKERYFVKRSRVAARKIRYMTRRGGIARICACEAGVIKWIADEEFNRRNIRVAQRLIDSVDVALRNPVPQWSTVRNLLKVLW